MKVNCYHYYPCPQSGTTVRMLRREPCLRSRRHSTCRDAPITWNHEQLFGMVPIWSNVGLDDEQVLVAGEAFLGDITNGTISARTAIRGLQLALSLKSMTKGGNNLIFRQQPRDVLATPVMAAAINLPALDAFNESAYPIKAIRADLAAIPKSNNPGQQLPAVDDTNAKKRHSYCFIAAYLMKLIVKSPHNVHSGLRNMRDRHTGFYGPTRTVLTFAPTLPQIGTYKDSLIGLSVLCNTVTHSVAYTHQFASATYNQQEIAVLRYLGTLPYSYTGMHAYTLSLELSYYTGVHIKRILSLFYCNITSTAIKGIASILRDYEITDLFPTRDVTFRYCTNWSAQYFMSVRSKNCPHLVYALACTWKVLNDAREAADPEKIVAVEKIAPSMKLTLRSVGQIIGNSLKSYMLRGDYASPIFPLEAIPPHAVVPAGDAIPAEYFEDMLAEDEDDGVEEG